MIVLQIAAIIVLLLILQLVQLALVMRWSERRTRGLNYYGLSRNARHLFKRWLRIHAQLLKPLLTLLSRLKPVRFSQQNFQYRDVAGPLGSCSRETFAAAEKYEAQQEDIFVVTQMRSGTTWMQHVVYQLLTRGHGDLPGEDVTLSAVSPWLESLHSAGVGAVPLIGEERPSQLIKTHLPVTLCPFNSQAKFVYVVRHPLSCFASSVDFVRNNLRGFSPAIEEFEEWFCSNELMWWNTWADHAAGWWERAETKENVLVVRFEDMLADLTGVTNRLAAFLNVEPLDGGELDNLLRKCDFAYMQQHADAFEMHPPHLLQAVRPFFVSGKEKRAATIPDDVRERVLRWCIGRCAELSFPVEMLYPDVVGETVAEVVERELVQADLEFPVAVPS